MSDQHKQDEYFKMQSETIIFTMGCSQYIISIINLYMRFLFTLSDARMGKNAVGYHFSSVIINWPTQYSCEPIVMHGHTIFAGKITFRK